MELFIRSNGSVSCLYSEELDLSVIGRLCIRRASHVEPGLTGCWFADLSPVQGPRLGPFTKRSDALAAEVGWLNAHHLPHF